MSSYDLVHSAEWWIPIVLLSAAAVIVVRHRRSPLRRLNGTRAQQAGWTPDFIAFRRWVSMLATTNPRRLTLLTAGVAAAVGLLVGGPVAAIMLAVYSILAVRAALRWTARRAATQARSRSLDDLCALAGQLRAGLPPPMAGHLATETAHESVARAGLAGAGADPARLETARPKPFGRSSGHWPVLNPGTGDVSAARLQNGAVREAAAESGNTLTATSEAAGVPSRRAKAAEAAVRRAESRSTETNLAPPVEAQIGDARIADLTAAVWRLAERTGAPAAELVERIEADARAADRAGASAAAQAAGAQATAMLLAALPLGGIGLGYSIGTDPLEILLHTRAGAACAIGAVLLQCAGLWWSDRLVSGVGR